MTSGNSPYTTIYNNDLVEVTDGGLSVVFWATPYQGQRITVIWTANAALTAGPLITSSGGFGIEDIMFARAQGGGCGAVCPFLQ